MTPITIEVDVNAPRGVVDALLWHINEQKERRVLIALAEGTKTGEVEIVAARRANRWQALKQLVGTQLQSRRDALDAAVAFMKRRLDEGESLGLTGYDEHRVAVEILQNIQNWMDDLEAEDTPMD